MLRISSNYLRLDLLWETHSLDSHRDMQRKTRIVRVPDTPEHRPQDAQPIKVSGALNPIGKISSLSIQFPVGKKGGPQSSGNGTRILSLKTLMG